MDNKKQINGFIDHNYKGHKVRLYGEVVKINEADETAKMKFENGVVANGIPMEVITIDEGLLDKLKSGASKAMQWLKGKFEVIGGMIRKMWNGVPIPFTRASNIGQMVAEGKVPDYVGVYLSDEAKAEAQKAGVTAQEQEAPERTNEDEDVAQLNADLRIIVDAVKGAQKESKGDFNTAMELKKRYVALAKQSGNKVFENLDSNPMLNDFFGIPTTINEAVKYAEGLAMNEDAYEKDLAKDAGLHSYDVENIVEVNMSEVVNLVMMQLKAAFKTGEFDWTSDSGKLILKNLWKNAFIFHYKRCIADGASEAEAKASAKKFARSRVDGLDKASTAVKPVLVWGAPGIGKTTIIQQTRAMFKNATQGQYSINMLECVLSKMSAEDFTLPKHGIDEVTLDPRAINAIQSWIPCWQVSGNAELDEIRDQAANMKMNKAEVLKRNGVDFAAKIKNWKDRHGESAIDTTQDEKNIDQMGEIGSGYAALSNDNVGETGASAVKERVKGIRRKRGETYHEQNESMRILEAENWDFVDDMYDEDEAEVNAPKADVLTDGGIVFFDELTRAPKAVMNVIMNLINDRKVGEGWVLGSHWIIVCAANRFWEMGSGATSTWEKAFGTRFINVCFVPRWEDWKAWAMGYNFNPSTGRYDMSTSNKVANRIDQDIIDFLEHSRGVSKGESGAWNEKLANADSEKSPLVYANPRSWQTASDLMVQKATDKHGADNVWIEDPVTGRETINLTDREKEECISLALGRGAATTKAFHNYSQTKYYDESMVKNIIDHGSIKKKTPKEIADIIKNAKINKADTPDNMSKEFLENYLPYNKEGQILNLGTAGLGKVMENVFSLIDWSKITNTKLANVLAYFAVMTNVVKTQAATTDFDTVWKFLFRYLVNLYINEKTRETLPSEVIKAFKPIFDSNGQMKQDKSAYTEWMKPAHQVFRFVHSWDGMIEKDADEKMSSLLDEAVEDTSAQSGAEM